MRCMLRLLIATVLFTYSARAHALECHIENYAIHPVFFKLDIKNNDEFRLQAYLSNPIRSTIIGSLFKNWETIAKSEERVSSSADILYGSGEATAIAMMDFINAADGDTSIIHHLLEMIQLSQKSKSSVERSYLYTEIRRTLIYDELSTGKTIAEAISEKAAHGNLLLTGLTELNSGTPILVDLGSVAQQQNKDRGRCLATILIASGVRDNVRRPVRIDSRYWVDGDITESPLIQILDSVWNQDAYNNSRHVRVSVLPNQNKSITELTSEEVLRQTIMKTTLRELYRTANGLGSLIPSGYAGNMNALVLHAP